MPLLDQLVTAFEPWSTMYSNSTALSVGLTFAHLGALMLGGGLALAADRTVLRAARSTDAAPNVLLADAVGDVHRPVVAALTVSAVSGVLQLAADLEALALNKILWLKLGLLALLMVNGLLMLRDERRLRRNGSDSAAFSGLRLRAISSVVLWFAIVLAGVGLMQG